MCLPFWALGIRLGFRLFLTLSLPPSLPSPFLILKHDNQLSNMASLTMIIVEARLYAL